MSLRRAHEVVSVLAANAKRGAALSRGWWVGWSQPGELTTVEESTNLKMSSREDIIGLGLERGSELVLLQLRRMRRSHAIVVESSCRVKCRCYN